MSDRVGVPDSIPTRYVGPNANLIPIKRFPRIPLGTDKNFPVGQVALIGANPSTGNSGDLWYLAEFSAGVADWRLLSASGGSVTDLRDQVNALVNPTNDGYIDTDGATVANAANPSGIPFETVGSTNTMTFQVQVGAAITGAPGDKNDAGLVSADDTVFAIDADGYMTLATTGLATTITGDSGGALSPASNNWNILGGTGVSTSGSGATLTVNIDGASSFTTGSVIFWGASAFDEDNANFFWDDTTNRLGIGTTTPIDTLTVVGAADIIHTSTEADDHALEIECNAAGFGDVKGLDIDYITGALAAGDDEEVILVNIDESLSTGGEISGYQVLATSEGLATIHGYVTGINVNPILHNSGTFGDIDNILNKAVDVTAALASGGAGAISAFVADNDTVTYGDAAKWNEMEFILGTGASGAGIAPTFEFSTGGAGFTAFTPSDGTNGLRNTGAVLWIAADLVGWATNASGLFEIRHTRTRNSLTTTPILDEVQLSGATEFVWDSAGDVNINSLTLVVPLTVPNGGTGLATITDHGIMLGSGTGAVTPLGEASNGQLPIGSTGADPVLATITGGVGITVTNGAGTITIDSSEAEVAKVGVSNLGISLSAGTFSITSADGSALSSSNKGYVTLPSVATPGTLLTISVEDNHQFVDDAGTSTILGTLWGTTADVDWSTDMLFTIYAIMNDADDEVAFGISRSPAMGISYATANIGASGTVVTTNQNTLFLLDLKTGTTTPTITEYDTNPAIPVGSFRMTKTSTTANDWTVSALGDNDGIGRFQYDTVWSMPAGVNTAASGTFFVAQAGDEPIFSFQECTYTLSRSGIAHVRLELNNCTTAGTGGTNIQPVLIAPSTSSNSGSDSFYCVHSLAATSVRNYYKATNNGAAIFFTGFYITNTSTLATTALIASGDEFGMKYEYKPFN